MAASQELDLYAEERASMSVSLAQCLVLVACLLFGLINWLVKTVGPPSELREDEWKWRNLWVSWVHAMVASVWVLACTFYYPEMYADLIQHIQPSTYYCVCFSTGYFLYDLLDLVLTKRFYVMWEVSLHHIMVAGMFYCNLVLKSQIGFNMVALSVEVNSVFLHWRKLLQMVGTPYDSLQYRVVKYLNLLTFLVFRGSAMTIISLGCIFWWHRVPPLYLLGMSLTAFLLDVLHIVLFWRLLKSDLFRTKPNKNLRAATSSLVFTDGHPANGHHCSTPERNHLHQTAARWTTHKQL